MPCPTGPLSGGCRGQNERDLKILKIETVTVTIPVIQVDTQLELDSADRDRDNAPGSCCAGPPHYLAA